MLTGKVGATDTADAAIASLATPSTRADDINAIAMMLVEAARRIPARFQGCLFIRCLRPTEIITDRYHLFLWFLWKVHVALSFENAGNECHLTSTYVMDSP